MIKNIIFIFIFLFLFFNNCESINPPTVELNCLKNLINNFKIIGFTDGVDYCSNANVGCMTNGTITSLNLKSDGTVTTPIESTDFSCFYNLNSLELNSFTYSLSLVLVKLPKITNLSLKGKGITCISSKIIPYNSVTLDLSNYNCLTKMSYFEGVSSLSFSGSSLTLDGDVKTTNNILSVASFKSKNIPDLSAYKSLISVNFNLVTGFNETSLDSISSIGFYKSNSIGLTINLPTTYEVDFPTNYHNNLTSLTISGRFRCPGYIFNLRQYINLKTLKVVDAGSNFNNGMGSLALMVSPGTHLDFRGYGVTSFTSNESYFHYFLGIHSNLTVLNSFTGFLVPREFDFSDNQIQGTIQDSWCVFPIKVANNLMTGFIPSCYYCYLNDPEVYNSFSGNSFTNLDSTPNCTTFKPKIRVDNLVNITIYGQDLGFKASQYFKMNSSLSCTNWDIDYQFSGGKRSYKCTIDYLKNVEYFWINFVQPMNLNYTFPVSSKNHSIASIKNDGTTLTISGKYFSSYLDYVPQTVYINVNTPCQIDSTSFFEIKCKSSVSTLYPNLITLVVNGFSSSYYIKGAINNQFCKNNCNGKGTCNLYDGSCTCSSGYANPDCSGIQCDDPDCSNGGSCNTTTGICKCDSNHQGFTCSLPYIQCPYANGLLCSGIGTCNNQTGICSCQTDGTCPNLIDCSGNGQKNPVNGTCVCDPNYQGEICNLPFIQCPIKNGLICSGYGSCNNQTGICTCDPGHLDQDCSVIPCGDPLCSNHGQCMTNTGKCQCDINWTGDDCSILGYYATSVTSGKEKGGNITIYGHFKSNPDVIKVLIGDSECVVTNVSDTEIICNAPSGNGIKDLTIYLNEVKWIGKSFFEYIKEIKEDQCTISCNKKNGKCVMGKCECYLGYIGYDCNSINATSNTQIETINNQTETTINESTASGSITNGEINYQILISKLVELDINSKIINSYELLNNWKLNESLSNNTYYYFSQDLKVGEVNKGSITLSLEIIELDKDYIFGDTKFSINKNSIKLNVNISNYQYLSNLNNLQLQYQSITENIEDSNNHDGCNKQDVDIDSNDLENNEVKGSFNYQSYVTINNKNKVLYGRFINRVISDGKPTFSNTKLIEKSSDSVTIGMNLPHCVKDCVIDPDFNLLISSNFETECSDNKKNYIIPVAVVVSLFGFSALLVLSIILIKKNKWYIKSNFKFIRKSKFLRKSVPKNQVINESNLEQLYPISEPKNQVINEPNLKQPNPKNEPKKLVTNESNLDQLHPMRKENNLE